MNKTIIIVGLTVCLSLVSIGYYDLNEEHETLELNYGYAMEMAKDTLKNPKIVNEIKERIVESNKNNLQI